MVDMRTGLDPPSSSTNLLTVFLLCETVEKWQAVYTILEAFGSSSTSMNSSASRFSHVVSLDFDQAGQVASASIQVPLTPVENLEPAEACTVTTCPVLRRPCCWRS